MKPARCVAALFTLGLLASQPDAAHGARVAPPGQGQPVFFPGTYRPGDAGSAAPAPSYTGGQAPSPSTTPESQNAPPQAPTSAQRSAASGVDLTEWTWWWQFNRDAYLDLKQHIRAGRVLSGAHAYYLGRGERTTGAALGQQFIWEEVMPALLATLEAKQSSKVSADELTASLIALAKIIRDAPEDTRARWPKLQSALSRHLTHANQEVAETAVIALGIAGGQRSSLVLAQLLVDDEAGRELLDKTSVPVRTRAFSAYALALLGAANDNEDLRRLIVHRLLTAMDNDQTKSADLQVACVIALGRVPLKLDPSLPELSGAGESGSSSLQAQISTLLQRLKARDLLPTALAQIPTSLGFLVTGEGSAAELEIKQHVARAMLDLLKPGNHSTSELQQSAMIALGMLGDDDVDPIDVEIRERLEGAWSSFKDQHTRHMASIALAEVSTRRGSAAHAGEHLAEKSLIRKLSSRRAEEVLWSALALGIHGRGRTLTADFKDPINSTDPIAKAISRSLRDAKTPLDVGAFATGLGLLGSPLGMEQVAKKLSSTTEERALGHVAVAAGLLNIKDSIPELHAWIASTTYRIFLTQELAIALALLEDRSVAPMLMERLANASSLSSQASLAQALGRVGDDRTLGALLALYKDQQVSSRARAFAAVAMGIVANQGNLPWNTIFKVKLNYLASTDTLFNHAGNGVLNIL